MEICNKCDEDGSIFKDHGSYVTSHSCDCGKYHRVMEAKFKDVSIEDLLNYGRARVIEKSK